MRDEKRKKIFYKRCVICKEATRKEEKTPYASFVLHGFHFYIFMLFSCVMRHVQLCYIYP